MNLFYVKEHGFVNAGKLYIGDKLLDSNGSTLIVEDRKVETIDEPVKVYNFQVEDFHTYHVGENCVLVHNASQNYATAKAFEEAISTMDSSERVATVKQEAAEVAGNKGLVKDPIISKKNGRTVYKDTKTGELYSVDTQHGRFETANKRGVHQGEVDFDFNPTKPADTSGRHDLKIK